MNNVKLANSLYKKLLSKYLESQDKAYLVEAEVMSGKFIKKNILLEEIIHIHLEAIEEIFQDEIKDEQRYAFEFLHESLSSYRKAYENLNKIQIEQDELKAEIQVAATMQKELMTTDIPSIEGLDIGAISVPYHQMNGDYYRFIRRDDGVLGVAIADIIGKGVPAALSMSMIKYAMDSFYIEELNAQYILQNLNRVVAKNIASHMFITMFYGQYYPNTCTFKYASAGHEPGYLYTEKDGRFTEIEAKGLVLGVEKNSEYKEYELKVNTGDKIILLTDGVTECRRNGRFIRREELINVIGQYNHLPAQQHVNQVYSHFEQLDDFELKDDFTLVIIKKEFNR